MKIRRRTGGKRSRYFKAIAMTPKRLAIVTETEQRPPAWRDDPVKPQADNAAALIDTRNDLREHRTVEFEIGCQLGAVIAWIDAGCAPDLDLYIEKRIRQAYANALVLVTPQQRTVLEGL